jgi:hypothetical protein
MKRNPKPFAVEIKKSRVQDQRHHLRPKRLIAMVPAPATKVFQKEEPQGAAEPAAPRRILPSLVEPVWSHSGAVEPVHSKRFSRARTKSAQIELNLDIIPSEEMTGAPAEASVILEAPSQSNFAPVSEESAMPACEVQPEAAEGEKTKSRKTRSKAPEAVRRVLTSEAVARVNSAPKDEVVPPSPVATPRQTGRRRLVRRQAAAAQLPRHERWKRRLHPASW